MSYKKSLEEILNSASVILTNAQRSELVSLLSDYGYTVEKLAKGSALLTNANNLFNLQKKEYGDQFDATDTLIQARDEADKIFRKHVKLAKIAFEDERNVWKELGLSEGRKRSISGWITQATLFYKNAIANQIIKDALGVYGITEAKLTECEALVVAVTDANAKQEHEKSEAQKATQDRDFAIDELNEWITKFISVAKIAFEDDPQVLESLGIVVH